eukprot:1783481-Pyramimonas_sp.AAC.1
MAKSFAFVLRRRVQSTAEAELLLETQCGFRGGRGCEDDLRALRTVAEESAEWGENLRMAALGAAKAFGGVHHGSVSGALIPVEVDASVA